ncbi:SIR2 family protein [Rhizobium binae]|uniref:SIR2 family protein n=1 Tax=Rhizobium binae TaxID=1138190 RepID=UPI003DAA2D65
MALAPSASNITIRQTLDVLDGPFRTVATGVAEDRYAFWLGSGISFGKVDGLKKIIPRVIEFLRQRIDRTNANCAFATALNRALALAGLSDDEWGRVNTELEFAAWPDQAAIVGRLTNNYSRLLEITVAGQPEDYLLWEGVGVAATFANPTTEPDVEHLCMAMLVLEGAASDIATANWDGLVEKAINELTGGIPKLVVCVRSEDLRQPKLAAQVIKFHGCAILAVSDEPHYRPFLVARFSQINRWAAAPENRAVIGRLMDIAVSKPTLMMGLSAQDSNIQAFFATAEATMRWPWPGDRPSFVFSGDQVGADQEALLRNVYPQAYTAATRDQINQQSLVKSYANPLLMALLLSVICDKLSSMVDMAEGLLDQDGKNAVKLGIVTLRNHVAGLDSGDRIEFVKSFIDQTSRIMTMFRDGSAGTAPRRYNPITSTPLHQIAGDQNIPSSGLTEVAVVAGLLGLGIENGLWSLEGIDSSNPADGIVRISTTAASTKMVLAANGRAAIRLQQNGHIADDEDAVLVYSAERPPNMTRSPRSSPGRTGHLGLREVSIYDLLQVTSSADDLMQHFREEAAI